MTNSISQDPDRRIGIYKRLSDVPERYRLAQFTDVYQGRNIWQEFVALQPDRCDSDHFQETLQKASRSWNDYTTQRGRHHALATPRDVETWRSSLAETRTLRTIYTQYWVRLEQFYSWLYFHTQHPHVYHSVPIAAAKYNTSQEVWQTKLSCGNGSSGEGQ